METATSSQRGQHHSTTSATSTATSTTSAAASTSHYVNRAGAMVDWSAFFQSHGLAVGASCSIAVAAVKLMQAGPPGVQRPSSWLVLQTNQQLLASTPVGKSARPTNWDADDQAQAVLGIAESLMIAAQHRAMLAFGYAGRLVP